MSSSSPNLNPGSNHQQSKSFSFFLLRPFSAYGRSVLHEWTVKISRNSHNDVDLSMILAHKLGTYRGRIRMTKQI